MQSSIPDAPQLVDEAQPKRVYTAPQLDDLGDIRSATLGAPSPPLESGPTPQHP